MAGRKKRPPLFRVTTLKATYVKPDIIRTETSAQAKLRLIEQKLGNCQEAERNEGGVWLREKAGIIYRTSCESLGLRDLAAMPEFGVCLSTLQKWCVEDNWVERRKQYFQGLTAKFEQEIGRQIVNGRVQTLKNMTELFDKSMALTTQMKIEPNSLEGMLRALVSLSKHLDELRQGIGTELVPRDMDTSRPNLKPQLSLDESRKAALMLARDRTAAVRARIAAAEKKEEDNGEG